MKKRIFVSASVVILSLIIFFIITHNNDKVTHSRTIDLIEVIHHPQDYPNIDINRYNVEELKEFVCNDSYLSNKSKDMTLQYIEQNETSQSYDYFIVSLTCAVDSLYECHPYFYLCVNFDESGEEPLEFIKILNANIDRKGTKSSKQFGGSLYCHLEDQKTLYWDLNGDFYNSGITTSTLNQNISENNAIKIDFSVSNSKSHYKYCQQTGRIQIH